MSTRPLSLPVQLLRQLQPEVVDVVVPVDLLAWLESLIPQCTHRVGSSQKKGEVKIWKDPESACDNSRRLWEILSPLAQDYAVGKMGLENIRPDFMFLVAYPEQAYTDYHDDIRTHGPPVTVISMSVVLKQCLVGGEMRFERGDILNPPEGSATIFPGAQRHQVLPVAKGFRLSLVAQWVTSEIPITENLELWQAKADESAKRIGPYRYDVVDTLDERDLAALRRASGDLHFAAGRMAHEGEPNYGRRIASVASFSGDLGERTRQQLWEAFRRTNAAIWRCDGCKPAKQLLWNCYDPGGFITWHEDTEHGDPRTFTVVTLVSPAARGGVFQLNGIGDIPLEPGQSVIFPAHVMHRVSPVLQGQRDTLTLWINSPHDLIPTTI